MNWKDYVNHPLGKGSSINTKAILVELNRRYNKLVNGKGHFEIHPYIVKDKYYIVCKNKSETYNKMTYDVVIEFSTSESEITSDNSLHKYDIKVFSNSPSFVFAFANTFKRKNMAVEALDKKFSKIVRKEKPEMRNPYDIVSYEKTLVFTFMEMQYRRLFTKSAYKKITVSELNKIFKDIRTDDYILAEYNKYKKIEKAKRDKEKKKAERANKPSKPKIQHKTNKDGTSNTGKKKITPKPKIKPKKKR